MTEENEIIWEPETDPLEIEEAISIKDEKIDTIKEENENYFVIDSPNAHEVPIKEEQDFDSKIVSFSNQPTIFVPETSAVNEKTCNCMKYIEHYCAECEKATFYNKNMTQCQVCMALLKLQCQMCHKRYKFLSSVHQYALQYSKRLNFFSNSKKQIILKCLKKQNYCCSKCLFKTFTKELLDEHIKNSHGIQSEKLSNARVGIKENDDEYIQLYCLECTKTLKRTRYKENVKEVCQKCPKEMNYQCTLCLKIYKLLKNAHYHVKNLCLLRPKFTLLLCEHCNYKTHLKSRLQYHMKINHIPQKCAKCNAVFISIKLLEEHESMECKIYNVNAINDINVNEVIETPDKRNKILNNATPTSSLLANGDDDGSYAITENNPKMLMREVFSSSLKELIAHSWKACVQYHCLYCKGKDKSKLTQIRPKCPNCNTQYFYQCINCEKVFSSYYAMCRHVRFECKIKRELRCTICNYASDRKYHLINHIKSRHTVYKCLRCNCKCEGYMSLRRHQSYICKNKSLHDNLHVLRLIGLYCKECSKVSRKRDNGDLRPCERCTAIMHFQCLKCSEIFRDRDVTYNHIKDECKPNFQCDKCNFSAYFESELDTHIKYVHTHRQCVDCGETFETEHLFRLHRTEELKKKEQTE